ncbi:endonuclease/exonuclease/phosphatase family protein [Micromonospora auratinigra]|uniref:Metal-dependent hydrolase, endonuclease/exonuclease/phosphatase family n=1 Tax=Micromonospora auratinigra TaxID=261654 RepID=A0A1A9A9A4_9ACTN|nr:endonuclease/exonuclease/phosphatase family protein [Micromonospora auratinigra]SBT53061.1 Metal-dependent hydrolase, endonuclease/exonuclease/phosphatase family [Micromonospora auratinigra]
MRHRHLPTAAVALGVAVLLDVLRVWLPSIITIFGRAAETPAELLGAFALCWFLLALAAPSLVRRLGSRPVGLVAAGTLAASRLALTAAPGGRAQLWLACAGLLAGLVWLAATAASVDRPVPGLALGLAGAAVGHGLLGTEDLVWRGGVLGWTLSVLLVLAFLAASAATPAPPAAAPTTGTGTAARVTGARSWLLLGPALLLAGQVALAPALWSAAFVSGSRDFPGLYRSSVGSSSLLPVFPVLFFLLAALHWPATRLVRVLWPVVLLVGAGLFAAGWLVPAMLLTGVGLGGCLALTDTAATKAAGPDGAARGVPGADGVRRGYAAVGGMLVFAVATVVYYATYDLGYPNGWVPVGTAVLVALVAFAGPSTATPVLTGTPRWASVAPLVLLTVVALEIHRPVPTAVPPRTPATVVRVVAYNIRMGFGLDGRLDLDAVARVVRAGRADVVLLSEVDRGWLLNGGHDTLALLAQRLRLPYVFAPAADPVWGDAVLSRFPVRSGRTRPLAAHGAPTGAQALGITLDLGGRELAVVATHLQPPPGRGPVAQAREVAAFATRYAAGRPLVLGGDLNTEPGEPAFTAFTAAGLVDALAAARPLPTSPADDPRQQIDHVFVSPGIGAADVAAPRSTASDHLPVAVTLTLP